jgi:hypothetical protein
MSSAGVKPCHTASSYCGSCGPRIAWPAVASNGPIVTAGKVPTSTQAATSSAPGTSIGRGSCGTRGRSSFTGPKNTS